MMQRRAGWSLLAGWMPTIAAFMVGAVLATDFAARPALTRAIANPLMREAVIVLGPAGVMALCQVELDSGLVLENGPAAWWAARAAGLCWRGG